MASIPRLKAGSSAEQVECRDELITYILSRVSATDLLRMSTVSKRWRSLIFDPDFAHTHYKNCHRESIFFLIDILTAAEEDMDDTRRLPQRYQFCSYNSQTGNLSIAPFSWEGLDSSVQNGKFELFTASNGKFGRFELFTSSNGLMCFDPSIPDVGAPLWVYNPVRRFSKKLSVPFQVYTKCMFFAEICYKESTLKFVMAGVSHSKRGRYTLVFYFQSNSWYEGPPLLRSLYYNSLGTQLFFNGVIYFVAGVESIYTQELEEVGDVEALFRDDDDLLQMIIGCDVNQDQWVSSIFIPASVGFVYCLIEWERNLLACASNSTHEENLFELAASSTHKRIRYSQNEGDGRFVFWILDTEHKLWVRERELDLSHQFHTSWKVSASGGVVWFASGYNFVTVYHMKKRRYSIHPLDDAFPLLQQKLTSFVSFEPTLLPF